MLAVFIGEAIGYNYNGYSIITNSLAPEFAGASGSPKAPLFLIKWCVCPIGLEWHVG